MIRFRFTSRQTDPWPVAVNSATRSPNRSISTCKTWRLLSMHVLRVDTRFDLRPPASGLPSTLSRHDMDTSSQTHNLGSPYSNQDPRSSSAQSLAPLTSASDRRTLLLIYVHGFLGNETSFQHFPAHVHNILSETLRESHVVHTKVYPRYKTRSKIAEVKYQFSEW